ncbi:MAG: hypothetical protein ACRCZD_02900 [Phycicoccus sp.]
MTMPDEPVDVPHPADGAATAAPSSETRSRMAALVSLLARTAGSAGPTDLGPVAVDAWLGCLGSAPRVSGDPDTAIGRPPPG